MFTTPKIQSFIQGASFQGKDEKKYVRFQVYVGPISHDLAEEVSPAIASLLFKKDEAGAFHPVLEMDSAQFEIGAIPLQTMEMHPIDDPAMDLHGVLLQGIQISNISARKVFPGDPNFTLIFNAELPKNELAVQMMDKYFREKVFLTFAVMQGQLFPDEDVEDTTTNPLCEECGDRAVARDSEHAYFCQKHLRKGQGEVKMIVTLESPAQAEARILAERDGKAAAAGENQPSLVMGGAVTPIGDKDDTSYINRKRAGKKARVH
jgi:hypothetical protein